MQYPVVRVDCFSHICFNVCHALHFPTSFFFRVTRRVDLLENLLTAPQEQLYLQQWKDARKELATLAIDAELTSHT